MLFYLWNYMVWVRDFLNLENIIKNFGGFCKIFVFIRVKKLMVKSLKIFFFFGGGFCVVFLMVNMSEVC